MLSAYIVHSTHTAKTRGDTVDAIVSDLSCLRIDGWEVKDINSQEQVNQYVSYAEDTEAIPNQMVPDMEAYRSLRTNLHLRQLSCALKHVEALRRISQLSDDRVGLVLEDDVQYSKKSVVDRVHRAATKLQREGCGLAFLGFPVTSNDPGKPTGETDDMWFVDLFETFRYFPPSVESYLVTPKAARILVNAILPLRFMFHIHLGYTLKKLRSQVSSLVLKPNIFIDGSKAGAYVSSLLPQAHLIYDNDYMTVLNILSEHESDKRPRSQRETDASTCLSTLKSSSIAHHPAMLHLLGKVHALLLGQQDVARTYLEQAYEDITTQDTYINNETQILRDLMRTYGPSWETVQ